MAPENVCVLSDRMALDPPAEPWDSENPDMAATSTHKSPEGAGKLEGKNKNQPQVRIIIRLLLISENPPNADCF